MATLYEPSGKVTEWWPKNGKTFSLAELQAAVDGDIELVLIQGGSKLMLVNTDGKPNGLPINEVATKLMANPHDFVVGNALVCSPKEVD